MILFGLGNPGRRYRFTRHNAGYLFVEKLARRYKKRFARKKDHSISLIRIHGNFVALVKPKCWMNQCGSIIKEIIRESGDNFMVVLDDINLPAGRIRLRSKGSDGGHLGLRSMIDALQTENFPRMRIGIGQSNTDAADYVLERFTSPERRVLKEVMSEAIKGIQIMFKEDFTKAQNYINAVHVELDSVP